MTNKLGRALFAGLIALIAGLLPLAQASQSHNYVTQIENDYRNGQKHLKNKKISAAITSLKKAANAGHEKAQYQLGIVYYQQKQYEKARYWLRKRSNAGDADAQYHYANTFRYALGTTEQTSIARRLYQKAAKQGHVNAQFELAKMFQNGVGARKNQELAIKWYKTAAEKGHTHARQALAILNPAATKVTKKAEVAQKPSSRPAQAKQEPIKSAPVETKKEILLSNAFKGDADQQFRLAMRYLLGYEIDNDESQAIYWLTKAAQQKHPMAEYYLADQYFKGKNIEQNIARAVHYFLRAQANGVVPAKTALEIISTYGYENIVKAEMGDKQAQYELALDYLNGNKQLDKTIALEWLSASAAQSYSPALLKIGKMYENGEVFEKNDQKAFDAYQQAAELNDPDAQFRLGKMYLSGKGTEADQALANTWINRAASQGLEAAQKALQFSEL